MILSNPQAFFGLRANVTPTAPNVRNDNEVGVSAAGLALTGGNVAYSLRAKLALGDVLDLDVLTGDASGSTLTDVPETITITGITDPAIPAGGLVLPRGEDISGFPQWSATLAGKLWIVRNTGLGDWTINEATSSTYAATKTSAADSPVGLTGWTVSTGTGQPIVAGEAFGLIEGGTGLDIYGETLPAITDVQGVLIQCISGAADIEVNGNELKQVTAGDTRCAFNVAGMPSYADTLEATATAAGTILEITIIGKTA